MSYHIRLIKALSYYGFGGKVEASHRNPDLFLEDKATADAAVETGFFSFIGEEDRPEPEPGEDGGENDGPDYEKLASMTKAELTRYAQDEGIDISQCKTKEDILEAISVANGGSYNMLDIMRE